MTVEAELDAELAISVDYVPGVRGHCVLAVGADADGRESVAVWKLGPSGRAGGSWVVALEDTDFLVRVIAAQQGRCLVGWTADEPLAVLDRLPAESAKALADSVVVIPDLLAETAEHRRRYEDAVEAHRATTKSKIAPLAWARELPADPRGELTPQLRAAASPVAAAAIGLAGALERAVDLWQETEQARYRRPYLRKFGEPQPLPPRWLARARAVAAGQAE
ncbi:DUF6218 family protein [Symbioplanes lichenis]|uniref:DUF6218 family protein n=1 Tax=Symbioplanes lichenis TaxID=1629072 RepID=UPI0027384108|nr:DUF6218 family protein [Actinoplanes lichenis]